MPLSGVLFRFRRLLRGDGIDWEQFEMITELEVENFKAFGMRQLAVREDHVDLRRQLVREKHANSVAAAPETVDGAFTNRLSTPWLKFDHSP
jgi:hypothetical protein